MLAGLEQEEFDYEGQALAAVLEEDTAGKFTKVDPQSDCFCAGRAILLTSSAHLKKCAVLFASRSSWQAAMPVYAMQFSHKICPDAGCPACRSFMSSCSTPLFTAAKTAEDFR